MKNDINTTTPADRRSEVEAIARQLGVAPHQLTVEVAFACGQLQYAQQIAVSEGVGSGELPDRLQARVAEREAELRRLLDEQQGTQDDDSASTPENPQGWRRKALERLQEIEQETASMSVPQIGKALRDRLYMALEVQSEDEIGFVFQTEELSRKGLDAITAVMLMLDEFAYPDDLAYPDVEPDSGESQPAAAVVQLATSAPPAAGNALVVDDAEGTLNRCRAMLAFASQSLTDREQSADAWIQGAELGLAYLLDQVDEGLRDAVAQVNEQTRRRAGGAA
ncbi:MAG: hypothetical protein JJU22_03930 [Gammaproteobacteria bacterium]|nr:hypothetical protein [Gammaproteobacteria bacterium]